MLGLRDREPPQRHRIQTRGSSCWGCRPSATRPPPPEEPSMPPRALRSHDKLSGPAPCPTLQRVLARAMSPGPQCCHRARGPASASVSLPRSPLLPARFWPPRPHSPPPPPRGILPCGGLAIQGHLRLTPANPALSAWHVDSVTLLFGLVTQAGHVTQRGRHVLLGVRPTRGVCS